MFCVSTKFNVLFNKLIICNKGQHGAVGNS